MQSQQGRRLSSKKGDMLVYDEGKAWRRAAQCEHDSDSQRTVQENNRGARAQSIAQCAGQSLDLKVFGWFSFFFFFCFCFLNMKELEGLHPSEESPDPATCIKSKLPFRPHSPGHTCTGSFWGQQGLSGPKAKDTACSGEQHWLTQ